MSKLVAVLVGVGLLLAGASGAEARAGGPPAPSSTGGPADPGFQCATARVPRDYARPHGPQTASSP